MEEQWQNYDFAPYDTVIHVAAIIKKENSLGDLLSGINLQQVAKSKKSR